MNKISKTIGVLVGLILIVLNQTTVKAQEIAQPELAKEIRAMRDTDQKLRRKWAKMASKGETDSKKFKKLTNTVVGVDSANTVRMREIITQYGWPTYDLVGKGSSVSAWLLVQHADRDPLFQIKCLPLLKEASEAGQADTVNYAYLYDRVQVAKGEKQLYATQSSTNNGIKEGTFFPIEDESDVQNRRATMGFDEHIETYARSLGFEYKVLTEAEALAKAENQTQNYKTSIEKAKAAMKNGDYHSAATHFEQALTSNGSIQTENFVGIARAYSLGQHKESPYAASYLIKAAIRGYKGIDEFDTDPDFDYIKKASVRNWNNLLRTVQEMNTAR